MKKSYHCFPSLLAFVLIICITQVVKAQGVPHVPYSSLYQIEAINVSQIFDRTNQSFVPFPEQLPSPFGLDMDLLVTVKISQKDPDNFLSSATPLTLRVEADSYETPATGLVASWEQTQTRFFQASDSLNFYLPFLVEYQCYPQVKLTAILGNEESSQKSVFVALPCAE